MNLSIRSSFLLPVALVLLGGMFSKHVMAGSDTGKIVEAYAHPNGMMALRLDNGLPNSNAENNCGSVGNQWAGVDASDQRHSATQQIMG